MQKTIKKKVNRITVLSDLFVHFSLALHLYLRGKDSEDVGQKVPYYCIFEDFLFFQPRFFWRSLEMSQEKKAGLGLSYDLKRACSRFHNGESNRQHSPWRPFKLLQAK